MDLRSYKEEFGFRRLSSFGQELGTATNYSRQPEKGTVLIRPLPPMVQCRLSCQFLKLGFWRQIYCLADRKKDGRNAMWLGSKKPLRRGAVDKWKIYLSPFSPHITGRFPWENALSGLNHEGLRVLWLIRASPLFDVFPRYLPCPVAPCTNR